jgi:hypothetical protein
MAERNLLTSEKALPALCALAFPTADSNKQPRHVALREGLRQPLQLRQVVLDFRAVTSSQAPFHLSQEVPRLLKFAQLFGHLLCRSSIVPTSPSVRVATEPIYPTTRLTPPAPA